MFNGRLLVGLKCRPTTTALALAELQFGGSWLGAISFWIVVWDDNSIRCSNNIDRALQRHSNSRRQSACTARKKCIFRCSNGSDMALAIASKVAKPIRVFALLAALLLRRFEAHFNLTFFFFRRRENLNLSASIFQPFIVFF